MNKDILEGNKLIAKFMNVTEFHSIEDRLQYHSSWDWLMPVWLKIGQIFNKRNNTGITIHEIKTGSNGYTYCRINYRTKYIGINSTHQFFEYKNKHTQIDCVWKCSVKFIQWYNIQKHPTP